LQPVKIILWRALFDLPKNTFLRQKPAAYPDNTFCSAKSVVEAQTQRIGLKAKKKQTFPLFLRYF
jgi:hypothetical protein